MPSALQESRTVKRPRSIAVVNYKGGVGKTTVSYLLGLYLSLKTGREVLLIDIDAQCSLTFAVGFEPDEVSTSRHNVYHLVKPDAWPRFGDLKVAEFSKPIPKLPAPVYIVPGAFDVENLDVEITEAIYELRERGKSEFFLYCRQLINSLSKFRYVIVDTPPNRMYLTQGMLRACRFYVPVTIPDGISVYGMPRLRRWVDLIPNNERPNMLGYILNAVNRSGGSAGGMVLSQQAQVRELNRGLGPYLTRYDNVMMSDEPCLGQIPRLDQIAKFMGRSKEVRLDFARKTSNQPDVDTCLKGIADKVFSRIEKFHA